MYDVTNVTSTPKQGELIMFVLTWNHTRTGLPMTRTFDTMGQVWVQVLFVRTVFPNHQFFVNGQPV